MIVCLLVTVGFIIFESNNESAGSTIYVGSGAGNQTTSIQDAIDNFANDGDTVFVYSGTYYENVIVNKSINLIGEDRNKTIIDGQGIYDTVFVSVDWVNVSELSITNSGYNASPVIDAGIELYHVQNCSLFNLKVFNNLNGIYLNNSDGNTIIDNTVFSNDYEGIRLDHSILNNITNNTLTLNGENGIFLYFSSGNTITGNNASDNGWNGIYLFCSPSNTVVNNTCNSNYNHGIWLAYSDRIDIINNNASSNRYCGILVYVSSWNKVINNTALSNQRVGIWIAVQSMGNNVTGNTASSNYWNGILLLTDGYGDNIVFDNHVSSNLEHGIHLRYHSNGNTVIGNNISNNANGIYLSDSSENNIVGNNVSFNNGYGIGLGLSRNNRITGNVINNNSEGINLSLSSANNVMTGNNISNNGNGIAIFYSHDNTIVSNSFYMNTWYGIDIKNDDNNTIYHNNFIDNNGGGVQARDNNGANHWDDSYPSGGNYWNDWTTPDTMSGPNQDIPGSDGFVDLPYSLDGGAGAKDYYPFTTILDISPPIITNLQPPDASTINNDTPTIGADYSDPSGIDVSSVVLKVDGIDVTSSATVTASSVSYIPASALLDGGHTVYLEVKDVYGNLATATWTFTVDTTPPTITNLQPPDASTTNDNYPTISADYSDPSGINVSSVVLEVDGLDVTSSATVTASGVSYLPGVQLSDGIHTVYLEVKDNYGNVAIASWSFTVDTTPPIITNLQPPDASTTNDNTPTISADYSDPSGINVSSVVLEVDGIDVTSFATVTASGMSYIPGMALLDGIHTVYLEVKDNVDNLAIVSWSFTVDTTPPTIILNAPMNNSVIPAGTLLDFNITDPNLTQVNYSINGSADFPFSDPYDLSTGGWTDGNYTVQINALDLVGNLNSSWYFFTIDSNPPTIILNAPGNNSVIPDGTVLNFTVFDITLVQANYSINGGADIPFSDPFDISTAGWVDGDYVVQINALDILGHSNSSWYFFTIDSTPPTITNLQPPNAFITNDNTPTISADYSDPSGINASSVSLEVDGIDVTLFATVTASGASYIPGTALSDGIYTVYLEVKDIYGNLATMMWNFTVDATKPTISNLQPPDASITNDNIPTIIADYSDSSGINVSSVLLEVDGIDVTSSATVTASGVSYTPGTALSEGVHTIYLEVKDNVDNLATATWSFTVDTTPPITTISPGNYTIKLGTLFTLTATDGGVGSGVNYTQYKIDDGNWIDYSAPFSIDTYEYHNITYRSVDNLGNFENENTLSIYVPKVPMTTLNIGTPQYGTTPRYVNQFTQFSFSVIDYSGTGYDTYYNIDTSPSIPYIGPFTVSTEGAHTIYYYSTDNLGNIENTKEFDIIVDNTPPTTDIAIGDPNYVSGDTWVTSATEFTLNAVDDGLMPVGVNHTKYRIWDGTWSDWGIYQNDFVLGVNDGIRYVEFYSVDWLGNEEPVQNVSYSVDNTLPMTTISVGDPKYKGDPSDNWNVTSATIFTLSTIDDGVGLNYTEYRIWNNGSWSDWYIYAEGFELGSDNGTKYVEWFSVDYLGNKEMNHNQTYFVDNIPPETNYLLLLEPDNTEARISLIPGDVGSGVNFTKYRIDSGDMITYSDTFVINESGEHVIYFWSADKLGNVEKTNEFSVLVEEPGTPTPPGDEEKETNSKPLIALVFSIILLLVGSYISYKRPLKLKEEITKNRLLTWLIVVLPFVIAETITGVVSLFTGMLSVPPLLGVGMIVDLVILVMGLVADGYIYKKGRKIEGASGNRKTSPK